MQLKACVLFLHSASRLPGYERSRASMDSGAVPSAWKGAHEE